MSEARQMREPPVHTTHIVRNQSERRGPVLAVCVHDTESLDIPHSSLDIRSIRNWFDNPASDASSNIGVDGDGRSEQWVKSDRKAWACGAGNSFTENIEFIGRAAQKRVDWEEEQIKMGAAWAAYWCIKYNFAAQKGVVRNIKGQCVCTKPGIIRHSDITAAGFGTHTDPGKTFPMTEFLDATRWYKKNGWYVKRGWVV
jgi:N-acetyl-anhydromuramyl-L-alanine amidase AmpD